MESQKGSGFETSPSRDPGEPMEDCDLDDIILVVNKTGWFCKTCNFRQNFGSGESMEAHLRQCHDIYTQAGTNEVETNHANAQTQSDKAAPKKRETCISKPSATLGGTQGVEKLVNSFNNSDTQLQNPYPQVKMKPQRNKKLLSEGFEIAEILGPRKRKRTAKVLELESQRENQRKKRKSSVKIESGQNSSPVDVLPSSPETLPADACVELTDKPKQWRKRRKASRRRFAAAGRLRRTNNKKTKSKGSLTLMTDLQNKYILLLDQDDQVKEEQVGEEETSNKCAESERSGGSFSIHNHPTQPAVAPEDEQTLTDKCDSRHLSQLGQNVIGVNQVRTAVSVDSDDTTVASENHVEENNLQNIVNISSSPSTTTSNILTLMNTKKTSPISFQAKITQIMNTNNSVFTTPVPVPEPYSNHNVCLTFSQCTAKPPAVPEKTASVSLVSVTPFSGANMIEQQLSARPIMLQTEGSTQEYGTHLQRTAVNLPYSVRSEPEASTVTAALFSSAPSGLTSATQTSSISLVNQDDAQTLELVTGALQELQDNLLSMPTPAANMAQEVSTRGKSMHVSELVLTGDCPPMQQFEQHVARIVQQSEMSENLEQPACHQSQTWAESSSDGNIHTEQVPQPAGEDLGNTETSVTTGHENIAHVCSGVMHAESPSDPLIRKLCDIIQNKTVVTEADIEALLKPNRAYHRCDFCEHIFASKEQLKKHVARYASQKPVQCKVCDLKLHSLHLLNVHVFYTHETESDSSYCFTCGKCFFGTKTTLLKHIISQHTEGQGNTLRSVLNDSRGMHQCTICAKKLLNYQANVVRHYRLHKKDEETDCLACGEKFLSRSQLREHLEAESKMNDTVHQAELLKMKENKEEEAEDREEGEKDELNKSDRTDKQYFCDICGKWNTRQTIRKHLLIHAKKELLKTAQETFHCPDCGKDIPNVGQNITTHLLSHLYKCKYCDRTFRHHGNYRRHESQVHLNQKSIQCEFCGKMMSSKFTLKTHIQHVHGDEKQQGQVKGLFSCDQCPRSFRYQGQLEAHREKHSPSSNQTVLCKYCNKPYMHKKSLERHIQVEHLGIKDYPHKCDQCPAQFFDSVQLRDHIAYHHQNKRNYRCTVCGDSFVCRPTLMRHMRRDHEGYSPYVCGDCGKSFVEKAQLLLHTASHTGIEPFQCSQCSKTFTRARSLHHHMNLHAGIRPHTCQSCGKAYVKKNHLARHQQKCLAASAGSTSPAQ